jgi:hypothetical protein
VALCYARAKRGVEEQSKGAAIRRFDWHRQGESVICMAKAPCGKVLQRLSTVTSLKACEMKRWVSHRKGEVT